MAMRASVVFAAVVLCVAVCGCVAASRALPNGVDSSREELPSLRGLVASLKEDIAELQQLKARFSVPNAEVQGQSVAHLIEQAASSNVTGLVLGGGYYHSSGGSNTSCYTFGEAVCDAYDFIACDRGLQQVSSGSFNSGSSGFNGILCIQ